MKTSGMPAKALPFHSAMDVLTGGGEMGERMRRMDWNSTPLGPVDAWPQNLKTCIRIILTSRQPMFVWWGDSLINLYNDAYKSIVGGKHPAALAQPASVVWREIWDQVGPRAEATMQGNEGTYDEALLLIMERNGYKEETYYTFSYSPVPNDHGGTGGIICANTDDTRRVIGERRLALLRELATRTANARTLEESCAETAKALDTNPKDMPFALVYRFEPSGDSAVLAAASGSGADTAWAPDRIPTAGVIHPSLRELFDSDGSVHFKDLDSLLGQAPVTVWGVPATEAVAMPISTSGLKDRIGFLIVGLNPYLPLNEDYRNFLDLVAGQVSTALSNGLAYEEEKRRVQSLADLDRAKTEFFSNVSHEFRTPLTLMLGPAEDLLNESGSALSSIDRDRVALLHRNSLRLMKLVNTLLDFSRLESGRTSVSYEPIDLAGYTRELASAFEFAMERAGLDFRLDCPALEFPVFADRDMWEKIVLNLLSNAFKFTFKGGIAVSLAPKGDGVELIVSDTGVGIPESELPNLFKRFHRVPASQARTHEGSGIGLALVQELVHLHHGTIEVESVLGRGTRFKVYIPSGSQAHPMPGTPASESGSALGAKPFVEEALRWLPEPAPSVREPETGATRPLLESKSTASHERIFLVDDNRDMGDYLKRILSPHWSVETFPDGAAALEAALLNPPDLVLSDVMMPRLDGFGLLKRLKEEPATASIPVILLSARAGEEATVEGISAGADDYLVKPFSSREVIARVGARLEIARLRKVKESEEKAHLLAVRKRDEELAVHLERETTAHAEAEVQRARLDSLFTEAPALIAIVEGADYVFEFANPMYRALLGGRELIGKPLKEVLPGLEGQAVMDILAEHPEERGIFPRPRIPVDGGLGFRGSRGKILRFRLPGGSRSRRGKSQGVAVYGFEVTTQVRSRRQTESLMADLMAKHERLQAAESALRENQDKLQLTLEAVKLGTWDFHPETGGLAWSSRTREIFGLDSKSPMDFETFQSRIHPDERERVLALIRNAMEPGGNGTIQMEHRIVIPGAENPRWVEGRGKALFDEDRKVIRVIGTVLDITNRKQAEAEIQKFKTLVEESGDFVFLLGKDGVLSYANSAARMALGLDSSQSMEKRGIVEFCSTEDRIQALGILDAAWVTGSWDGEFRFVQTGTGKAIPIQWNVFVLRDPDSGQPFSLASVGRDLTQIKSTEERLRQTQKMEAVGKLAGGIAHDFNNLLTSINGYADLAMAKVDSGELHDFLHEIRKSGERAATLTRQLLAYSRKQVLTPKSLVLNSIVQNMESMVSRLIGEDIALQARLAPDLGKVKVDPGQVEQILLNLIFNARDAMPNGGTLEIKTETVFLDDSYVATQLDARPGSYALLEVRDSGIGMDKETLEQIFEPFFTTKSIGKGTGLGLSSVYGIVKQSGGNISVWSEPGKGAAFRIYFPIIVEDRGPLAGTSRPPRSEAEKGHGRVLLVEDEAPVRQFIRTVLAKQGYDVVEAKNGEEALELSGNPGLEIALLLTDVVMPGMSGVRSCASIPDAAPKCENHLHVRVCR